MEIKNKSKIIINEFKLMETEEIIHLDFLKNKKSPKNMVKISEKNLKKYQNIIKYFLNKTK
jgi:hypothetical protein